MAKSQEWEKENNMTAVNAIPTDEGDLFVLGLDNIGKARRQLKDAILALVSIAGNHSVQTAYVGGNWKLSIRAGSLTISFDSNEVYSSLYGYMEPRIDKVVEMRMQLGILIKIMKRLGSFQVINYGIVLMAAKS